MKYSPIINKCLVLLVALLLLNACATPTRRSAAPVNLQASTEIPGMPGVRYCPVRVEDIALP